jgi:hypothetical protein
VARWAAGWQRQVGGAQQSLDYLGALGRSLGELKTGLSRTLALGTGAPASLRQQRDAVAALWEQRRQATAGTLDNQGEWTADGGARRNADQGPGPDQPAKPGAGGAELFGAGHAPAADLAAGGHRSPAEALRALDDALAPAGLQTRQDEDGTVWFSVAEDQWPALRDGLTVRGGGQRFPAGQPARLRMEAQPDVLQARSWGLESTADQRATLQAVVRAQDWVRRQSDAAPAPGRVGGRAAPAATTDAPEALAQAEQTARQLGEAAGFGAWATLLPALGTLRRERVEAVLAPR